MSTVDRTALCAEAQGFAELFFDVPQLALILDMEEAALQVEIDQRTDLGKAILVGWLQSEAEYRKSVIKHAKQGSTAAQSITQGLINNMRR